MGNIDFDNLCVEVRYNFVGNMAWILSNATANDVFQAMSSSTRGFL